MTPLRERNERNINGVPFHEAAASLFETMSLGFDRDEWLSRLAAIPGINVSEAENELRLLDLFAAQHALRTAPRSDWRNNAATLFDDLLNRISKNCEAASGSDSAAHLRASIDNRITAYSSAAASEVSLDPDDMVRLIGMTYAMIAHPKYSPFNANHERDTDLFATAFTELFLDNQNATRAVGEDLFRNRVTSLHAAMRP